jgi:hypothetical protein
MAPSSVMRAEADVSEETEAHPHVAEGVVTGRANSAERAPWPIAVPECEIDRVEHCTGTGGGGVP